MVLLISNGDLIAVDRFSAVLTSGTIGLLGPRDKSFNL